MNKEINIIGNGYMGSQISALYLSQGYKVNIFFHKNQNEKLLNHNIKLLKKKFPNNDLKNFEFFDNLNNIKNFPTIECVSENLELKKKYLIRFLVILMKIFLAIHRLLILQR